MDMKTPKKKPSRAPKKAPKPQIRKTGGKVVGRKRMRPGVGGKG